MSADDDDPADELCILIEAWADRHRVVGSYRLQIAGVRLKGFVRINVEPRVVRFEDEKPTPVRVCVPERMPASLAAAADSARRCVMCEGPMPEHSEHVDTCSQKCFRALLRVQREDR